MLVSQLNPYAGGRRLSPAASEHFQNTYLDSLGLNTRPTGPTGAKTPKKLGTGSPNSNGHHKPHLNGKAPDPWHIPGLTAEESAARFAPVQPRPECLDPNKVTITAQQPAGGRPMGKRWRQDQHGQWQKPKSPADVKHWHDHSVVVAANPSALAHELTRVHLRGNLVIMNALPSAHMPRDGQPFQTLKDRHDAQLASARFRHASAFQTLPATKQAALRNDQKTLRQQLADGAVTFASVLPCMSDAPNNLLILDLDDIPIAASARPDWNWSAPPAVMQQQIADVARAELLAIGPEFTDVGAWACLSSSAGHPAKLEELGLRVVVILSDPLNAEQRKAWMLDPGDPTCYRARVCGSTLKGRQVCYIAAPNFPAGMKDPVSVRHAFVPGTMDRVPVPQKFLGIQAASKASHIRRRAGFRASRPRTKAEALARPGFKPTPRYHQARTSVGKAVQAQAATGQQHLRSKLWSLIKAQILYDPWSMFPDGLGDETTLSELQQDIEAWGIAQGIRSAAEIAGYGIDRQIGHVLRQTAAPIRAYHPPTHTLSAAEHDTADLIETFLKDSRCYVISGRIGDPPAIGIGSTPAVGKTRSLVDKLQSTHILDAGHVIVATQDHVLAAQIVGDCQNKGIEAVHVLGRDQDAPADTNAAPAVCMAAKQAKFLSAQGLDNRQLCSTFTRGQGVTYCKHHPLNPNAPATPWGRGCYYRHSKIASDDPATPGKVFVCTHQHLTLFRNALPLPEHKTTAAIIIDETPAATVIRDGSGDDHAFDVADIFKTWRLDRIDKTTKPQSRVHDPAASQQVNAVLVKIDTILRNPGAQVADLIAAFGGSSGGNYTPSIHLDWARESIQEHLKRSKEVHVTPNLSLAVLKSRLLISKLAQDTKDRRCLIFICDILAALTHVMRNTPTQPEIRPVEITQQDDGREFVRLYCIRHIHAGDREHPAPLAILDGTVDVNLAERIVPPVQTWHNIHADKHSDSSVIQCLDRVFSKHSLCPPDTVRAQIKTNAARNRARVARWIEAEAIRLSAFYGRPAKLVVITYKELADPASTIALVNEHPRLAGLNIQLLWFGAQRGSNIGADADLTAVIGRYRPPTHAAENSARAIYWNDPTALARSGRQAHLTRRPELVRRSDGSEQVLWADALPCPIADQVWRYTSIGETEQAGHRSRLVRRPTLLVLLTDQPTGITVDNFEKWEVLKPMRIEMAWLRAHETAGAGPVVMPISRNDLARLHPDLWNNPEAANWSLKKWNLAVKAFFNSGGKDSPAFDGIGLGGLLGFLRKVGISPILNSSLMGRYPPCAKNPSNRPSQSQIPAKRLDRSIMIDEFDNAPRAAVRLEGHRQPSTVFYEGVISPTAAAKALGAKVVAMDAGMGPLAPTAETVRQPVDYGSTGRPKMTDVARSEFDPLEIGPYTFLGAIAPDAEQAVPFKDWLARSGKATRSRHQPPPRPQLFAEMLDSFDPLLPAPDSFLPAWLAKQDKATTIIELWQAWGKDSVDAGYDPGSRDEFENVVSENLGARN